MSRGSAERGDPPSTARRQPTELDAHIGSRLRLRRMFLGLRQQDISDELGLATQMVQKYEAGAARLSASRLFEIAQILTVPIEYFFEGWIETPSVSQAEDAALQKVMSTQVGLELIRNFVRLDEVARKRLVSFIQACVRNGDESDCS